MRNISRNQNLRLCLLEGAFDCCDYAAELWMQCGTTTKYLRPRLEYSIIFQHTKAKASFISYTGL